MFLGVFLQPGVVLQQLLHVRSGPLHLQNLVAQLGLQRLPAPLGVLQQRGQLPSLHKEEKKALIEHPVARFHLQDVKFALPQPRPEPAAVGTER